MKNYWKAGLGILLITLLGIILFITSNFGKNILAGKNNITPQQIQSTEKNYETRQMFLFLKQTFFVYFIEHIL